MNTPKLVYVRHNRHAHALTIAPHPISYTELTLLLKGKIEYVINGESITLNDGDALFLASGSMRERIESEEDADYVSFNFHLEEPPSLPCVLRQAVTGEVRLLLAACDEIQKKFYPDHEQQIEHLLAALLLTLQNQLKRQNLHPLVTEIIRYLRENISQKISLADVGNHTYFSPVYCDSLFKKEMGTSIIDYLLDERIRLAKQLLVEGSLTLRQIAEAVGFSDYNYFARTFKKRTGYTPIQYRRIVQRTPPHHEKRS